jgi:hypothetical protein
MPAKLSSLAISSHSDIYLTQDCLTHRDVTRKVRMGAQITELYGIDNADGGLVGEARYVVGHMLGFASCALCDITHSPLRKKPEWDEMVGTLGMPLTVLHRNELAPDLSEWISSITLPAIVGKSNTGDFVLVLNSEQLEQPDGSVSAFREMLVEALEGL